MHHKAPMCMSSEALSIIVSTTWATIRISTMAFVLVMETLEAVFTVVLEELTIPTVGGFTIPTMLPMPMVFTIHISMEVIFRTIDTTDTIVTITGILIA